MNIGLACLNVLLGLLYVTWRIMRGLSTKESWMAWTLLGHDYVDPEDPERTWDWKAEMERHWFAWTILLSEVLLMIGVWLTHFTRVFPTKRYAARPSPGLSCLAAALARVLLTSCGCGGGWSQDPMHDERPDRRRL